MWSEVPAVKIVAWRILTRLHAEGWPQDLLDMFYIDEETLALARATGEGEEAAPKHVDSNGAELSAGDSVVLIKDLDVKGSSLTAKRGTTRSEEHTSELQSRPHLVCRLLLEKKK